MPPIRWLLTFLVAGIVCVLQAEADSEYRIGVGRADCTGPPVEVGFVSVKLYYIINIFYLNQSC